MMKRCFAVAVTAAAVAIGTGANASATGTDKGEYDTEWTVRAESCDQLPAGTVLTGSGHGHFTSNVRTLGNGQTITSGVSHASGTAVDQAGNTYHWNYTNNVVGTVDESGTVGARMVDSFVVSGSGPASYNTGFKADFVEVPGVSFDITPVWVRGDPFDFANPSGRCDPI